MRPALLAAALTVAACAATPDIIVSQPGPQSPAELRTFAFRSSEAVTESGAVGRRGDARLRELVVRELTARGYSEPTGGAAPDFIVTYRLAVFVHENPRDAYAPVRDPGSLIGPETTTDPAGREGLTRESTLVLMALAGPGDKAIWQATASGVATTREELSAGALSTAEAMLERFPERRRSPPAGPDQR